MAVAIRLRREGSLNHPYYKVVVADQRSPRDGKFIEIIGTYDPKVEGSNSTIDLARVRLLGFLCGARPSDTVRSIIKKARRTELLAADKTGKWSSLRWWRMPHERRFENLPRQAPMKQFLELVVRQLVDNAEAAVLNEEAMVANNRDFVVVLPASEVGKMIGKQGHTIQAIRSLMIGAARQGESIRFEVEERETP